MFPLPSVLCLPMEKKNTKLHHTDLSCKLRLKTCSLYFLLAVGALLQLHKYSRVICLNMSFLFLSCSFGSLQLGRRTV